MKNEPTVGDVETEIHSEFFRNFKYSKVWDSSKYSGDKVGLNYSLKDKDIVEIHT